MARHHGNPRDKKLLFATFLPHHSEAIFGTMWTVEQKAFCVETFFLTGSYADTRRKFLQKFDIGHRKLSQAPPKPTIFRWVKKFKTKGTVLKQSPPGPARTARTAVNGRAVNDSVTSSPKRSTRHRSQALGLKRSSMLRILKESKFKAYKISIRQQLTDVDRQRRVEMAEWFEQHPEILENVWFTDEAHFWLSGQVNSHNAVHWGRNRPDEVMHKPLHSKKVTVWAAMRKGQPLIGPFFFEDENENTVSVTSERYIDTALKPFWAALVRLGVDRDEEWFQQDGATPHTARASLDWLERHFPGRHISLKTDVPWAPHSPDLSPLDFMLWGHLKSKVYRDRPATLQALKAAIEVEMRLVTVDQISRTVDHLQHVRLPLIRNRCGAHLEHLL